MYDCNSDIDDILKIYSLQSFESFSKKTTDSDGTKIVIDSLETVYKLSVVDQAFTVNMERSLNHYGDKGGPRDISGFINLPLLIINKTQETLLLHINSNNIIPISKKCKVVNLNNLQVETNSNIYCSTSDILFIRHSLPILRISFFDLENLNEFMSDLDLLISRKNSINKKSQRIKRKLNNDNTHSDRRRRKRKPIFRRKKVSEAFKSCVRELAGKSNFLQLVNDMNKEDINDVDYLEDVELR